MRRKVEKGEEEYVWSVVSIEEKWDGQIAYSVALFHEEKDAESFIRSSQKPEMGETKLMRLKVN